MPTRFSYNDKKTVLARTMFIRKRLHAVLHDLIYGGTKKINVMPAWLMLSALTSLINWTTFFHTTVLSYLKPLSIVSVLENSTEVYGRLRSIFEDSRTCFQS